MSPRGTLPTFLIAVAVWGFAAAAARSQDAAAGRVLDLDGRALDFDGNVLGIEGNVLEIEGVSAGLQGALADLGAKVTAQEIRIELSADVLFDFDKADLKPEAEAALGRVVEVLAAYPEAPITIEGHTDSKGKESYNQRLSERRAGTVREWLVTSGGVAEARLSTKGYGESRPAAPNAKPDGSDDPEGRQRNRRVEIVVRKG